MSESAKQISSGTKAASGIGAGAVIGVSILNLSSIAAIWSLVNQFQLFLLLLLTKTPVPDDVRGMILGNDLMSFNLSMIPFNKIPKVEGMLASIGFEQENAYLKNIGVQNGSGFNNNFGFLMTLFIFLTLHPLVLLLRKWIDYNNTKKWSINFALIKLVDLFTFTIYVRVFLEAFQILLITSLSEVLQFNFSELIPIISFCSSLGIIILCSSLCFTSFYMFFSTRKFYDEDKYYKLGEFFAGIKNDKYCRLYSFNALVRRTLMISWLIIFSYYEPYILSYGLLGIQIVYLCVIVFLHPFERIENNLIEIINEFIFLIMISFLIIFNTKNEWTSFSKNAFTYIILSNSIIVTIVMLGENMLVMIFLGAFISSMVKVWIKKYCKPPQQQVTPEILMRVSFMIHYALDTKYFNYSKQV